MFVVLTVIGSGLLFNKVGMAGWKESKMTKEEFDEIVEELGNNVDLDDLLVVYESDYDEFFKKIASRVTFEWPAKKFVEKYDDFGAPIDEDQ
jgi:hypothetical protein